MLPLLSGPEVVSHMKRRPLYFEVRLNTQRTISRPTRNKKENTISGFFTRVEKAKVKEGRKNGWMGERGQNRREKAFFPAVRNGEQH